MEIIGYIRNDYKEKFGIPRQSGLVTYSESFVEIVPPYNQAEAFRGLCDFSHIWLLWDFSMAHKECFTATVKPPKLGGNQRMGVWATRSPFRPNNIGLSSVKLVDILYDNVTGCVSGITVSGADLLDGTPILDIKPYLPYTDSHPQPADGRTILRQCHLKYVYLTICVMFWKAVFLHVSFRLLWILWHRILVRDTRTSRTEYTECCTVTITSAFP